MIDSEGPASLDGGDEGGRQPWRRTLLLLPRVALVVTRWGISRRLLWPGVYETRNSRSFGARIFRLLP